MRYSTRTSAALLLVLPALALGGCRNTGDVTNNGTDTTQTGTDTLDIFGNGAETTQDIAAALQDRGFAVTTGQALDQPFFQATGTELTVDGEYVQVFEYTTEEAAQQDVGQISDDASTIGTTQVTWTGSPHFFQDGKLVVLYVGDNDQILDVLEDTLGSQIAGASRGAAGTTSEATSSAPTGTTGGLLD